MERTCYNCFWGGWPQSLSPGHCFKHHGEADFEQPDKNAGCEAWAPNSFASNARAILDMIEENLTDWMVSYDDGGDLGRLYCNQKRCPCSEDSTDMATCRRCIEEWLQQPYAGNFRMDDSQLVVITEGGAS